MQRAEPDPSAGRPTRPRRAAASGRSPAAVVPLCGRGTPGAPGSDGASAPARVKGAAGRERGDRARRGVWPWPLAATAVNLLSADALRGSGYRLTGTPSSHPPHEGKDALSRHTFLKQILCPKRCAGTWGRSGEPEAVPALFAGLVAPETSSHSRCLILGVRGSRAQGTWRKEPLCPAGFSPGF